MLDVTGCHIAAASATLIVVLILGIIICCGCSYWHRAVIVRQGRRLSNYMGSITSSIQGSIRSRFGSKITENEEIIIPEALKDLKREVTEFTKGRDKK